MTFDQGSSANDAISQINVTPLVDVMLVLLIIFMVVTPLAQKGLDIGLPQADTKQQTPQEQSQSNQVVLGLEESSAGANCARCRAAWRLVR